MLSTSALLCFNSMRLLASTIALALGLLAACGSSNNSPDGGSGLPDTAAASSCAIPTGPRTSHEGILTADERWTAAASPHVVTFDMTVRTGATLTLEPCAVVTIKKGYAIVVEGHLVAAGSALQPVDIGPFEEGTTVGIPAGRRARNPRRSPTRPCTAAAARMPTRWG